MLDLVIWSRTSFENYNLCGIQQRWLWNSIQRLVYYLSTEALTKRTSAWLHRRGFKNYSRSTRSSFGELKSCLYVLCALIIFSLIYAIASEVFNKPAEKSTLIACLKNDKRTAKNKQRNKQKLGEFENNSKRRKRT